jgi:regulatory protein
MSTVTAVEKRGAVYLIYADGRLLARVDRASFAFHPLKEGDSIDEDAYLEAMALSQEPLAYEAALSALDRSAKTERALTRYLLDRGFLPGPSKRAVSRLKRARLIDDAAIAERLIQSGVASGRSKNALKQKLRAKGVGDEDIESALEQVSDEDQLISARKLAARMLPRYESLEKRAARAKLSQALARRGFSWDVIDQALDGFFDT